MLLYTIS